MVGGYRYDLSRYRRIFVIGGGKASGAMSQALEEVLGERLTAGWVNVKDGYTAPTRRIHLCEAAHPVPDERGVNGARRMAQMAREAGENDLLICLISGGGSALMTLPVEGVTLADMQALTSALLRCGATINEINTIRKHLSQIAGGNLARLAYPATLITLLVSDVVGSPLDVIASGPTVPDSSTYSDAWGILEKYALVDQLPAPIVHHLAAGRAGHIPETPKSGDEAFSRAQNLIVADNASAAEAAAKRAGELGIQTMLLSTYIEGEAREVAKVYAGIAKEIASFDRPISKPACVIAGGETTVTLRGKGRGGRNQELALSAAQQIAGWENVMIVTLATDGSDGPTDAAGAIAEGATLSWAREKELAAGDFLASNDSYHFFQALGDLLLTGPTNTNVNDLTFIFVF
jgi:hydroxypyruvate reductase